jgi:hypothetical protein
VNADLRKAFVNSAWWLGITVGVAFVAFFATSGLDHMDPLQMATFILEAGIYLLVGYWLIAWIIPSKFIRDMLRWYKGIIGGARNIILRR